MDGLPDDVVYVIECWANRLSATVLFRGQAEDLKQEFALHYWRHRHKHNPERGSLSTFTAKLLRTRAYTMQRSLFWNNRDRRLEKLCRFDAGNGAEWFSYEDPIELKLILKEQGYAVEEG